MFFHGWKCQKIPPKLWKVDGISNLGCTCTHLDVILCYNPFVASSVWLVKPAILSWEIWNKRNHRFLPTSGFQEKSVEAAAESLSLDERCFRSRTDPPHPNPTSSRQCGRNFWMSSLAGFGDFGLPGRFRLFLLPCREYVDRSERVLLRLFCWL